MLRPPPVLRSATVVRTATVALACLLLLLAAGPPTARAATTPAEVASALERSPVYIDPSLDGVISPTATRRVARAVKASGRPVYVALVPVNDGDRYDGKARNFLTALRSRFRRDGIFVGVEDRYLRVEERKNGVEVRDQAVGDAANLANYVDDGDEPSYRRTLLERLERFFANLRQSPARLAARVAADEEQSAKEHPETAPGSRSGDSSGGSGAGPLMIAGVLLLVALIAAWSVRRRRRVARAAAGPLPVVPARVFEHARAAERAELAEDADQELLALAALLDEQVVPRREDAQAAYQRALDAYTAARRISRDEPRTVDLVGILVLVDQARGDMARAAALDAGRRPPKHTPLCTFDPLHGRSAKTVKWERVLRLPACAACAADVRAGRTPDALRDGDVPYFEGTTIWAKTGFGAFSTDLVERISSGDR
ncbi:hypothetical protein AB0L40_23330 [Patulibacter sp. NPDC049589]|uniref:hypothetical protein n=1 Tax=Patulibacter sp. NPDC049589 TaxID=3154731 RepID=UPI003448EF64